jgi:Holin of 3TMs, for gene-transfer release
MGGLLSLLSNPLTALIDRLVPDKAANDAAKAQLAQMALAGELQAVAGQIQINLAEAGARSLFVSGWRPFVGWVCGVGLASQFLFRPFVMFGCRLAGRPLDYPSLDMGTLLTLLFGMLGLGAARTVEKVNGVAAK